MRKCAFLIREMKEYIKMSSLVSTVRARRRYKKLEVTNGTAGPFINCTPTVIRKRFSGWVD